LYQPVHPRQRPALSAKKAGCQLLSPARILPDPASVQSKPTFPPTLNSSETIKLSYYGGSIGLFLCIQKGSSLKKPGPVQLSLSDKIDIKGTPCLWSPVIRSSFLEELPTRQTASA
ncbi:MAG TPA: hypothetical protein VHK69_00145, partial [Chitinophagaceae bacterium]|nr:hypothetical protein [Chitinophagaceae bacterium]